MGRAIVREPTIYLMDEPLSNLDAQLRVDMRSEIARLQRRLGVTTVYVTHDQTEAMVLGDKVAVLKDGVLQQHATPRRGLRPAGQRVRRALHRLAQHEPLRGDARAHGGGRHGVRWVSRSSSSARAPSQAGRELGPGPQRDPVRDPARGARGGGHGGSDGRPVLRGVVELREELGPELFVYVDVDGAPPALGGITDDDASDDDAPIEASRLTVARLSPRSRAREGERIELTVDPSGVHLFDASTQLRLD